MSAINIDTSLLVIILVLFGPAFVFIQTTKSSLVAVTFRWHKIDLSSGVKPNMPHKDMLTYGTFPLVLAGILALAKLLNFTPFNSVDVNFLEAMVDPIWLVKYFAFTTLVAFGGILTGLLMAAFVKPMMEYFGIRVVNEIQQPETEQTARRPNRRTKRDKRNRRRS